MLKFELVSIWSIKRPAGTTIVPKTHDFYELVYYINGNCISKIGDNIHNTKSGNFVIIPPGIIHDEFHNVDTEIICLQFHSSVTLSQSFNIDTDFKTYNILKRLLSETRKQKIGYKNMISAKLTELCVHILRKENVRVARKDFEYIINYIKENYAEKISLQDCASNLGYSYDHFQHKFKRITGHSPQQFLLHQRLYASKKMLEAYDMSCSEIALSCGFSTSAQYSALFKREYGTSPSQYQKSHKSKNL